MNEADTVGVLVVGVQPGQVEDVVGVAAQLAAQLKAGLVCVWVDPSLVSGGLRRDGSEIIEPIDSDSADMTRQEFPSTDSTRINEIAAHRGLPVEVLNRVGDPARAIAAVAEEHDAVMIVVGTQSGRRRIAEFFNGSVAARLAHQQHRPVLVVPTDPVGFDAPLPWDVP